MTSSLGVNREGRRGTITPKADSGPFEAGAAVPLPAMAAGGGVPGHLSQTPVERVLPPRPEGDALGRPHLAPPPRAELTAASAARR